MRMKRCSVMVKIHAEKKPLKSDIQISRPNADPILKKRICGYINDCIMIHYIFLLEIISRRLHEIWLRPVLALPLLYQAFIKPA